jgi:hypothetical protein
MRQARNSCKIAVENLNESAYLEDLGTDGIQHYVITYMLNGVLGSGLNSCSTKCCLVANSSEHCSVFSGACSSVVSTSTKFADSIPDITRFLNQPTLCLLSRSLVVVGLVTAAGRLWSWRDGDDLKRVRSTNRSDASEDRLWKPLLQGTKAQTGS